MTRLRSISAAFAIAIALLSGCGSTEDPIPDTTVATVSITPSVTTIEPGTTVQLTATPRTAAGTALAGLSTSWTSSNNAAATVSSSGLVSGVATGSATITATISGVAGTRQLAVQAITPVGAATVEASSANVFQPAQVDLTVGGTVTWQFGIVEHNVNFTGSGAPLSIGNSSNTSVSRTFNTVGSFPYSCSLHVGMSGTVIVH